MGEKKIKQNEETPLDFNTLWDIYDLQRFLKIPLWTVKRMVNAGKIPYKPYGKHKRFIPADIVKDAKAGTTKKSE